MESKVERADKVDCQMEGRPYAHGMEICEKARCLVCNDGEWQDLEGLSSLKKGLTIGPGENLSDM